MTTLTDYLSRLNALLQSLPAPHKRAALRRLCRTDLFYLLRFGLRRPDVEKQWLFDRCREVQAKPNEMLDLWSREHYKSTVITFAKTIQDILATHGDDPLTDRELCFGIFSHTRPNAKGFLRQIKYEFEANEFLRALFPDVLWENPQKEAPKWSEDDGIIVKRRSNPKEATIEAWGLVDGQPTGKHFPALVYDDIVTRESVTTPDMIEKTTAALELSYNLGADGGFRRFIGTRYHFSDTYKTVMERGTAKPRIRLATEDGTLDGDLAIWTREKLREKRRDMGPYTFACQIMQNPKADEAQGFREGWLKFYDQANAANMNKYLLVDAANGKRKHNDYTAMWVVGLGPDQNYYLLDIVRDRLNLTQRVAKVMELHRKWKPRDVRYEQYGLMADVQHIKQVQAAETYRFEITEVGGSTPKEDRIKRLVPLFEGGRVWLPRTLHYTDYEGVTRDLVNVFVEQEYKAFPVPMHDDLLDSLARIEEPGHALVWPKERQQQVTKPQSLGMAGGWMG
jgi:predicted phage terminase large subunit-like protein